MVRRLDGAGRSFGLVQKMLEKETGESKDKREGSQGKNTEEYGMSSKRGVLWLNKGLWNVAKEKMLEERGALLTESGNQLRDYKSCARRKISKQLVARGCGRRRGSNEEGRKKKLKKRREKRRKWCSREGA